MAGPYFAALETMPPSFLFALLVAWVVSLAWPSESLQTQYRADLVELSRNHRHPGWQAVLHP